MLEEDAFLEMHDEIDLSFFGPVGLCVLLILHHRHCDLSAILAAISRNPLPFPSAVL